ncbi:ribose 5-phosphate isomerase B [Bremerella sp. T1]|uniref:ribose 5-phosphate isomerase B n=1 Tax=Bremerella sp. TYQ1 TaxID=3119568 RepID=UPI001CC98991|nr:ribose 5-phosphate isomerase B [Bremerella volcania]UBM34963.1 ribose 5-phosphate isomerase B [Bremerella volcania]
MKIAIASDHAGYKYKTLIIEHLKSLGHEVVDFGTDSDESCDYPDFIIPAAKAVAAGECERGIVLGGSGNGEAIAANRVHNIRCALTWNVETAQLSRQHNKANMISIGERMTAEGDVLKIVDAWLETEFEGGRHQRRIEKIETLSQN